MSDLRRFLRGGLLAFALGVAATAGAQTLSDPTAALPSRERLAAGQARVWTLQSTVIGPQRRIAVVNGVVVGIGDRVDGARVVAISHGHAELDVGGRRVSLDLFGAAPDPDEESRGTP